MKKFLYAGLILAFAACFAAGPSRAAEPEAYQRLLNAKGRAPAEGEDGFMSSGLRSSAQKDAALSAAIKAGTRHRYAEIIETIVAPHSYELDALFNFTPLLIESGEVTAMPPIIQRAGPALRMDGAGVVSVQSGSYKFLRSARIITAPPNWRNYLIMRQGVESDDEVHRSLYPGNAEELSRWRKWVDEGWRLGVAQADALFQNNMARLVRDYRGILIYYALASEGLVEKPFIKVNKTGTHILSKEVIYDRNLYTMAADGQFQKKPPQSKLGKGKK